MDKTDKFGTKEQLSYTEQNLKEIIIGNIAQLKFRCINFASEKTMEFWVELDNLQKKIKEISNES